MTPAPAGRDSPLNVLPVIGAVAQGPDVVDLARMVEIMLDHCHDDPAGLLRLAPVRHPRAKQLGIIQRGDTLLEPCMSLSQPTKSLSTGREGVATINEGIVPGELRV